MTFAFMPFIGFGISVEDIYFGDVEEPENAEKHIWVVIHLPLCRIGFVL